MLFATQESTEERIIRFLLRKNQTVKSLRKSLSDEKITITIQGIYKILRSLVSQEVIIKRAADYSLSEEWRSRAVNVLNKNDNRFELAEGERISMDLSSLVHMDQQWKNIILPLHESHPNDPTFFYNPHEIWFHLNDSRKASETAYLESFKQNKTYAFYLIGGNTLHDKAIKKELQNSHLQISVGIEYFSKTDYSTIFRDYIITTRLSPKLAQEIEECYQESSSAQNLENRLQKIGIEKKKAKLIIERNHEKAKKLRKQMAKDFHIPSELRERFDLF
jgi:hypothetical protein